MKKLITIFFALLWVMFVNAQTLRQAFEMAEPGELNGISYNKVIILNTGQIYTGGLLIGKSLNTNEYELYGEDGCNVIIVGNGAIIDLQGEQLCISYCDNRLDISDCVIINGNIRYRGITADLYELQPFGSVKYVTMYKPHDYGIRLQGTGEGITLERNIVVDAQNTGWDYIYTNGYSTSWLPTGLNYAPSIQMEVYGFPTLIDNWSFHSADSLNTQLLRQFGLL
ncbi:MAG: hypothetical protein PHR06_00825 [Candidatus Cloacimonetes bacterium]|nr:hypothetical protein [Candidatus Cloacimonadota bacterium]